MTETITTAAIRIGTDKMEWTWEHIQRIGDEASVKLSADDDYGTGSRDRLKPELWEALRLELQRRYRRATGEEFAVLTITNNPEA